MKYSSTSKKDIAAESVAQRKTSAKTLADNRPLQRNATGMPDNLKTGVENLSGMDMSDVKVHYNSSKPAQMNAHAFAQGTNIHISSGQEKHLPHEAWHVAQQKQGRVQPTTSVNGVAVNDNKGLEKEADVMGGKAMQMKVQQNMGLKSANIQFHGPIQRKTVVELQNVATRVAGVGNIPNNNPVFTIGATHTGDMYHVKAACQIARATHSNILITHVNEVNDDPSVNSAEMMASYFGGGNVYYTTGAANGQALNNARKQQVADHTWNNAVHRGIINEGGASSVIMYGMDHANAQDAAAIGGGHANRDAAMNSIADAVAPIDGRGAQYDQDLVNSGHFGAGRYVLVNFRQSGHRVGGVHPELDTGERGFRQLLIAIQGKMPGVIPVPIGEYDPSNAHGTGKPNLYRYWTWPGCAGGRAAEAGLLRRLKNNYNVVGAIGMRSGVTDLLALAGIPVISIDINPVARGVAGEPTDTQVKAGGWDRGMKLEKAFGTHYGRAFIRDARVNESANALAGWTGEFSRADDDRVRDSIDNYFHGNPPHRDASHPLNVVEVTATIRQLEQAYGAAGVLTAGENRVAKKLRETIQLPYSQVVGAGVLAARLTAIIH